MTIVSVSRHLRGRTRFAQNVIASLSTMRTVPADIKIFDRISKRKQRNWSVSQGEFEQCRVLRDEFGYRLADKVFDIVRPNPVVLDLGCGAGHIGVNLAKESVDCLLQCDMSESMVRQSKVASHEEFPTLCAIADEELVPFRPRCADLILSGLSVHWINDLPGWFHRCYRTLRDDGVLIGGLLAGETLSELRISLQLAETERLGGIGAHVSPFVQPQDIAALMTKVGFGLVTLDLDEIVVNYPSMFALLYDLQLMAESNASTNRSGSLKREILVAADSIYKAMFSSENNQYPATFQMISFIGWRHGANAPKTARRGSQNVSLKDLPQLLQKGIPALEQH